MSDFDDLFKSRLENNTAEVPDDMWSRIQNAQAPDDVKRPALAYWKIGVIAVMTLTIASFSIFFISNISENDEVLNSASNVELENSLNLSDKLKISTSTNNNLLIAKNENQETNLVSSSIEQKSETNNISKSFVSKINTKHNIAFDDGASKNTISVLESEYVNDKTRSNLSARNSPITVTEKELYSDVLLNKYMASPLAVENNYSLDLQPDYDKKCPKFGRSTHGYFSVEAYHASDKPLRTFSTDDEEFNPYLELRNSTETSRYSYSNGIRFKWHNSSGLGLGIGLDRNVINETFNFTENDAREVKVIISIDTTFNTDGSFTTSTDTTRVELQGTKTNRINNSYTSVDLPIHLSYQREFGRWAVGISGGVYVNLLFNQEGRILNFDEKPAWISSGSQNELDIYRARSGVKFDGSITVIYHLTNSLDIMVEPYFKYNPNSLTRVNHPLNQFYNTVGIRTGLRYNFGF